MSETEYISRSGDSRLEAPVEQPRTSTRLYELEPGRQPEEQPATESLLANRGPFSSEPESIRRLMSKTRRIGIWAERICRVYFSDPAKRLDVKKGEKVLTHGQPNDKLYYVVEGSFISTVPAETVHGETQRLEVFRSREGGFIGVRSFFSDTGLAVLDTTAEVDSVVMWMDRDTAAVEPDRYGSLREQFFPVIMKELEHRQFRLTNAARERVSCRLRMLKAEDMATLGQFAAGLAHELNNATSVLMSSSQHLGGNLRRYFEEYLPDLSTWFMRGMEPAKNLSSAEVRTRAREVSRKNKVDYETAKDLVRMMGDEEIRALPKNLEDLRTAWMTGRSCRDIQSASRHAANIIHSIKQLSSGARTKKELVRVGDSIEEARALLRETLKDTSIKVDIQGGMPDIMGNFGELMQIWLNIIKNAHEAMRDAATPGPTVFITARHDASAIVVTIGDNGPGIPDAVRDTLFQPSITTKTGSGQSMGLGLGLYIVKRLVEHHSGSIEVCNEPVTCFTVRLPLGVEEA